VLAQWQDGSGVNGLFLALFMAGVAILVYGWVRSYREAEKRGKREHEREIREAQREDLIWELWEELKKSRENNKPHR
jgi:hypothetical protein